MVLDDFPRRVHELLVVPDARVAYVPIFGVYLSEQRFKDEVYWSASQGLRFLPGNLETNRRHRREILSLRSMT